MNNFQFTEKHTQVFTEQLLFLISSCGLLQKPSTRSGAINKIKCYYYSVTSNYNPAKYMKYRR